MESGNLIFDMKKLSFANRIEQGEYVAENIYASGLIRIVQYLFLDLSDLLEDEGRRFGIVLSYLDSVYHTCKQMDLSMDDSTSGKIIFLYKPLILREFKKLCKKRVSRADSVIVIIKRILEIILDQAPTYQYTRETKSLLKIIDKLFDNIRNKAKNSNLRGMTECIEDYMSAGVVGKYELEKFSILEEEEKRIRTPLIGSGVRVKEEHSKILEVTWKDE